MAGRRTALPVLQLTGDPSQPILPRITDRLAGLLPHAERPEICGASHIVHAENPDAVNTAIFDVLDRRGDPPTTKEDER